MDPGSEEERHITDIASEYGVHHSAIHRWKKELLESSGKIFNSSKQEKDGAKEKQQQEETIEKHCHP